MSLIIGLILIGLIFYAAMFLAQFVIVGIIWAIALPIAGVSALVDKVRGK